jgi:nitroreductase
MASRTQTFNFGSSFYDEMTGLRFEPHHPHERPDLWCAYLEGGERQFAEYGLGKVFGRASQEHAADITMFFVGFDEEGIVRAGVRCHGPLEHPSQCAALREMGNSPQIGGLTKAIESYIPYGLLEGKGAWSSMRTGEGHLSFRTIFRLLVHAMEWFEAEHLVGTVSDRFADQVLAAGGYILGNETAPFPNNSYRTLLISWRRSRTAARAMSEDMRLVRTERFGLGRTRRLAPRPPINGSTGSWRPIVLESDRRADRGVVESLFRRPEITVIDQVKTQRAELERIAKVTGEAPDAEPIRTVYYPWRKTLVRTVGPRSFRRLRVERNRFKLTPAEQDRLSQLRVGIVGLSVGHAIAHALAMEGLCGELRLADFDVLETTNLNRLPGTVMEINENKAVLAARRIAEFDPYLELSIFPTGIDAQNIERFASDLDVIVEESDSLDAKLLVREVAKEHRIPVIMATSDRGLFDVERFDLDAGLRPFHGLLGSTGTAELAQLSTKDKVPYILAILEASQISTRAAASMVEIDQTVSTWPQLNSDVILGAATAAAAVRRIGSGEPLPSGRIRIDLDQLLAAPTVPAAQTPLAEVVDDTETAPADPIDELAHAAARAPSGGNMQPWRFEVTPDRLDIFLAPGRSDLMDVSFRGSYVAIGAALFNARCVAARQGMLGRVGIGSGEPSNPVVTLQREPGSDTELAALAELVEQRCSNRRHGDRSPLGTELVDRLASVVSAEGATLHLLSGRGDIEQAAEMLAESDRIRFLTPRLYEDLMHELRWPGYDDMAFGIDVRSLELDPSDLASFGIVRRSEVMDELAQWDLGRGLGTLTRDAVVSSSALAVISVADASVASYVAGGQAMERFWLEAQRLGISVTPVSPVFIFATNHQERVGLVGEERAEEVRTLHEAFNELLGMTNAERITIVARLHRAPQPSIRSRRFPLDALLTRH